MGEIKRWQIGVVAVAVVALSLSLYLSLGRGRNPVRLASTVTMVDVTTGDLFEYSVAGRRAVMVPGEHPDTGAIVLVPVERGEDGRWIIGGRYLQAVHMIEEQPTAVDMETGEVRVNSDRARRVR